MSILKATATILRDTKQNLLEDLPRFGSKMWKTATVSDLAKAQKAAKDLKEAADAMAKECNKIHDFIRKEALPEKVESLEDGTNSVRIEGVGNVSIRTDIYASVAAGKQEEVKDWLDDNDGSGLITETVNSSSLKAFLKKQMLNGAALPDDLFNITPYSYTVITK